ncbi:uncharacterized protein BT62DRAFT_998864 [Guyanagaster necrorhizus]|uniref:Uncharacterized protein n=1 Tax=Guyanagaster necrorhizus TaxID=856835 RepID=A0A9P8AYF4_9AGAR|nr:uncharacterized protein BT62DRAFT_998864 [Guyanagaster necrorhizus MCA 3950]KAG7452839.1 hypothetical protein BT62DRAFT_998864 [Guyanagaster necrorhizus MCA 3950]
MINEIKSGDLPSCGVFSTVRVRFYANGGRSLCNVSGPPPPRKQQVIKCELLAEAHLRNVMDSSIKTTLPYPRKFSSTMESLVACRAPCQSCTRTIGGNLQINRVECGASGTGRIDQGPVAMLEFGISRVHSAPLHVCGSRASVLYC